MTFRIWRRLRLHFLQCRKIYLFREEEHQKGKTKYVEKKTEKVNKIEIRKSNEAKN